MWVMWNLVLVYLEIVLVSVQDRSMICAELTNRPRLDAPMLLLGDDAQAEACFILFGDSANVDAR
jgi:hypothetical protein